MPRDFPRRVLAVTEQILFYMDGTSVSKILLNAQSDELRAEACLRTECVEDCPTDSLTAWTFSEIRALRDLPG